MAAGVGEVEDLDLPASRDALDRRGDAQGRAAPGPVRPSRPVLAVGAAVTLAVVLAGAWQHERAQDDPGPPAAPTSTAGPHVVAAAAAAAAAVDAALRTADPGAGQPVWEPPDLGLGADLPAAPLDLQVVGGWSAAGPATRHVGYRLLTDLPDGSGRTPCLVPQVRIAAWQYAQGGDAALPCLVMASGERGTAVRTGTSGRGDARVQVREVVLVSGGRTASVAAWTVGQADPALDLPALGAAAAALIATAEPS